MSEFNPQIAPEGRENFFRYSEPIKGIQPPESDKSTGIALASAGTALDSAATLAKNTAEAFIRDDVRKTVEKTRSDFTADLNTARDAIVPAAVQTTSGVTAGNPMDSMNLMKGPEESTVPEGVKNNVTSAVDKLDSLKSAFINGHINDTYYHMQLDKNVTSLRSKYPGFVDYIDEQVSKITGVVPANAVVNDLMQDINRAATNKKTEQDKILDLARGAMTKGFDKAQQMYQRLQADPSFTPAFLNWYTEENAKDTRLERDNRERANRKGTREETEITNKEALTDFISTKISSDLNATLTLTGANKPETMMDILAHAKNDPNYYSGPQMEEFATKILAHQSELRSQFILMTNQNGMTKAVGGVAARDAELDSQLKFYSSIYDAVKGGGPNGAALAYFHMNQANSILNESKYNYSKGPLSEYLRNWKLVSDDLGPIAAAQVLMPSLSKENIPARLQGRFKELAVELRAQPNPDEPITINKQVTDLKDDKRIKPEDKAAIPYVIKSLVNTVEDLKSNEISNEEKTKIVRGLFTPGNNSFMDHFTTDYTTPTPDRKGTIFYPGKQTVWTQLTDKGVTNAVSAMDETSKNYYLNWTKITGREIIGQDVRTLNHFTGHDNLYFEWTNNGDGKPFLKLKDKEGALAPPTASNDPYAPAPTPPPSKGYVAQVQATVDRINKVLPNLNHVLNTFGGGNTEQMLLETLQQYGMNFEGKVTGLPKAFGDAVAASRKPLKPAKEEK